MQHTRRLFILIYTMFPILVCVSALARMCDVWVVTRSRGRVGSNEVATSSGDDDQTTGLTPTEWAWVQ